MGESENVKIKKNNKHTLLDLYSTFWTSKIFFCINYIYNIKNLYIFNFSVLFYLSLILINCKNPNSDNQEKIIIRMKKIDELSIDMINSLSEKRIYFGHQSVGNNIIDGINEIITNDITGQLKFEYLSKDQKIGEPAIYHSRVGRNKYPESKIKDFEKIINSGIGDTLDIAFFKFCYVDIKKETDINKIFDEYKNTINRLENKYPNVKFVHVTVPLRKSVGGIKGLINQVKGKNQNCKRSKYNELIRNKYPENKIFDLAYFESTYPDGRREYSGKDCFALIPEYTNDNGHLNDSGKKVVSKQFLIFLSQLNSK